MGFEKKVQLLEDAITSVLELYGPIIQWLASRPLLNLASALNSRHKFQETNNKHIINHKRISNLAKQRIELLIRISFHWRIFVMTRLESRTYEEKEEKKEKSRCKICEFLSI